MGGFVLYNPFHPRKLNLSNAGWLNMKQYLESQQPKIDFDEDEQ